MRSGRLMVWVVLAVVLCCAIAGALLWRYPELLGLHAGSGQHSRWLMMMAAAALLVVLLPVGYHLLGLKYGGKVYHDESADDVASGTPAAAVSESQATWDELKQHLSEHYGSSWRRKVRLLLVVGEPETVESLAPTLTQTGWLEGYGHVLVHGGDVQTTWPVDLVDGLKTLRRSCPLDGVIWALKSAQDQDVEALRGGVRRLQELARTLLWQPPLYLWQVCQSGWSQATRERQSVGCLLQPGASIDQIETALGQLITPLREQGFAQLSTSSAHDFLLRLSRDLKDSGIARWRETLAPLLPSFARGVPLRGLLFSLPQNPPPESSVKHHWWPDKAWDLVREDRQAGGRRLGWQGNIRYAAFGVAGFCALAFLWSFASTRSQITDAQATTVQLRESGDLDSQLSALYALTQELSRLEYQRQRGSRFLHFGLSQNEALQAALWPVYAEANGRLMRDVAAANLEQQLTAFSKLPPGNVQRAERALVAREHLKAYLMMVEPQRTDATALVKTLSSAQTERPGVSPGLWQDLSPKLWQFYAEYLPQHPEWRIEPQRGVVVQARQVLLRQMGQRNGVANLYEQLLDKANNQYAALHLSDMVGETDAASLFDTAKSVPGVFTRQAWEGYVRSAIDEIAQARRDEIDWVLSDSQQGVATELQSEVLKTQLTERYFQDYSRAWLAFLNSIRWRQARNLSESIDQLTLMSDVRQSPLIALMNTLAYQGRSTTQRVALADSLVKSASQLLDRDKQPAIDQLAGVPRGPLEGTFGALLALLGKDTKEAATQDSVDDNLSLQAFLTRVTRVRLKLQQVATAPDPQAMTQALAQTVFRGTGVDLTDTLDYGSLLAASLGAEWGGFGQNLFVEPLNRAWRNILQPSAASLNRQWQRAIVDSWNHNFAGRYPFAATNHDASLPMLGQMIRSDSGRIEQFLARELGGVLHKEGKRWVVDTANAQGLRFNPDFLDAVNQLSELADILYTDGHLGLTFSLQAKPVRDVLQTTLLIDGVKLEHFNQMESWKQFRWPSTNDHPGASLVWTNVRSGARLFGDYQGPWGLLRLLEQAKVTPLDDLNMQVKLVLNAPDGLPLTWHMRAELGTGPLAPLRLRDFTLPVNIFEVGGSHVSQ